MGCESIWDVGSYKPGADIHTGDFGISAKSGNIRNEKLLIASYRLTRFSEIDEMITFIDSEEGKNFDRN